MFVYWILMALMIAITCFIGIIFEIIFSSDVISGVAVIIFAEQIYLYRLPTIS